MCRLAEKSTKKEGPVKNKATICSSVLPNHKPHNRNNAYNDVANINGKLVLFQILLDFIHYNYLSEPLSL